MSCPFGRPPIIRDSEMIWMKDSKEDIKNEEQAGVNAIKKENQLTYGKYLQLERILNSQYLPSSCNGKFTPVHDEHLFIIVHQTFELWFKQILHELDSVREIFSTEYLQERNQLCVISRLNRVTEIFKVLCSQFLIVETMTPQDFLELRSFLGNSSGFQSFQFRLLEIRLGVREELRVAYNKKHFMSVFFGEERTKLEEASEEKSLFDVVNDWLERTPGLDEKGFNFFAKFKASVLGMLDQEEQEAKDCEEEERSFAFANLQKKRETFFSLFDKETHDNLVKKGHRRFSHKAMQGALMVCLYRDEPRCHLPFQLLQSLIDIDNQIMKFRYNHTCMVQRLIGGKIGTGGSSGYLYLRSTCSDRYKIFIDLMNMSSFLVTRDRIPPLTKKIKRSLSMQDWLEENPNPYASTMTDSEDDSGVISSLAKSFFRISKSSTEQSIKEDEPSIFRF